MASSSKSFTYDNLNRLTTGLSYHPNGNIASKQGVGNYSYHSSKKHALTQVSTDIERGLDHQITYSATGKVLSIQSSEGSSPSFEFLYGPDDQRQRVDVQLPTHKAVRHYSQDYERTTIHDLQGRLHSQQTKEYIYSPYGLVAIRNNGNLQAVAVDHLGSIVAEYNPRKNTYEFFGYDAWGRRYRKDGPSSLYYFDEHLSEVTSANTFSDFYSRGYTGHEHIDAFGLINMNGRLYDPIVGRMLSPDPYVPDGGYTQDFNRYSYARNNPLSYVDPEGEWVHLAIGAVVGGFLNFMANADNIDNIWQGFAYFGVGALAGALGAGIGAGISAVMGSALSAASRTAAVGSFSAGFLGTSTILSTGFAAGFASGASGGATGGFLNGAGNAWLENGKEVTAKLA